MAQTAANNGAVLELLKALGVTPEAILAAVGSANVQATPAPQRRAGIQVDVVTGDAARKFGEVAISKVYNNGQTIPKVGVRAEDLDELIAQLQAAKKALSAKR